MPSPWALYAGLAAAIVGNIAAVGVMIDAGVPTYAGNIMAAIVCVGAVFLVRWRQRQGWWPR